MFDCVNERMDNVNINIMLYDTNTFVFFTRSTFYTESIFNQRTLNTDERNHRDIVGKYLLSSYDIRLFEVLILIYD